MKLLGHPVLRLFCFALLFFVWVTGVWAGERSLVVCAPGYPGSTAEAQPAMDDLARALTLEAGWEPDSLSAVYFEDEVEGVAALDMHATVLALVTLPFFADHHVKNELRPVAQAVPAGQTANQRWTLVAGSDRIKKSADLTGWEVVSLGGHSRSFVMWAVFDGWGEVPEGIDVVFSNRILTALRRAARGDDVALLLDGEQAAALGRLPFADDLEIVRETDPIPTSLLCTVRQRLSAEESDTFVKAAIGLADTDVAADALAGVRLDGFAALDTQALDKVFGAGD